MNRKRENKNIYDGQLISKYKVIIDKINSAPDTIAARDENLRDCNDIYTNFILEKLELNLTKDPFVNEVHHIIPYSVNGPDVEWNRMFLSILDHSQAHALRAEAYQEIGDINATKLKLAQTPDNRKQALLKSVETRKALGITVFDSNFQSQAGKIGGSIRSKAKEDKWKEKMGNATTSAFSATMVWKHKSGVEVTFKPGEIEQPQELAKRLHALVPFNNPSETAGSLTKVINKTRKSHSGWTYTRLD